ncbi:MAG: ABC transporter permease, partial [Gammaproteobacteria bacterium]|nr:ABC transporter permease [Gammaproteobacteria bacterium]
MALRQDAVHRTGRIILRAGHVLEDEDIRSLRAWGVTEVQIAGDEVVSGKPA